ncbi:hypothetical protein WMY93_024884 [Mugilogobius chulae]|uniref:Uncharacterized protein n=1 Tax=Mugilogobius chulae TaxID=88201 RepID=A0AAW0N6F2_9GOBI
MVNNIAANVLGGGPEMEGGAENGAVVPGVWKWCKKAFTSRALSTEGQGGLEPGQSAHSEEQTNSTQTSTPPLTPPEPTEERQIVTLVEEEEEEEPQRSTVTLMEEESEEEEETGEQSRAGKRQIETNGDCSIAGVQPDWLKKDFEAFVGKITHILPALPHLRTPLLSPQSLPLSDAFTRNLPVTEIVPEPETHNSKVTTDALVAEINDTHTPDLSLLLSLVRPPPSRHRAFRTPSHGPRPPTRTSCFRLSKTPPWTLSPQFPSRRFHSRDAAGQQSHPDANSRLCASICGIRSIFVCICAFSKRVASSPLPTASRPEDMISPPTKLPASVPATTHKQRQTSLHRASGNMANRSLKMESPSQ